MPSWKRLCHLRLYVLILGPLLWKRTFCLKNPHVSGDESQILQVFINLLNNAIQAMPKGGRLIVQTLSEDDTALVFVRDTGVGIAAENVARLFDPFFTTRQAA